MSEGKLQLDKPHRCDWDDCGKAFQRRSDLIRHARIHTGEKPYVCPDPACGKAFIQRSALTVHYRVHTGEKPHVCEKCQRAFSDSSSLARHRRVHTGARPFRCEEPKCGRSFCRKTTLTKHLRREHGIEGELEPTEAATVQDLLASPSPTLSSDLSSISSDDEQEMIRPKEEPVETEGLGLPNYSHEAIVPYERSQDVYGEPVSPFASSIDHQAPSLSPDSFSNDIDSHSTASSGFLSIPDCRPYQYHEHVEHVEPIDTSPYYPSFSPYVGHAYERSYPHQVSMEAGFHQQPSFAQYAGYYQPRPSLPNIHEPIQQYEYERRYSLPRCMPRYASYVDYSDDRSPLDSEPSSACSLSSNAMSAYLQPSPMFSEASCSTPLTGISSHFAGYHLEAYEQPLKEMQF